jgi:serine/threonine protein kinase
MIGSHLGDYEITASLGRGGFGSVWKAVSANGEVAAIKLLNPQALENQRVVKKFFNEAMILAKLDHPNITRLLEFFPDGDNYAIAMEFVEGTELKKILKGTDGPLPFDTAYKIAHQALSAFQYASESGVLHRDIKPGNIIIDTNGDAKIMDFGIARMSSTASHDTAASMLSIHYVPPERFDKNREIDVRSDIYSLALVFYELFAGKRPFDTSQTSQVIFAHINEVPETPISLNPALPRCISDAIMRALEKDPDDRFPDFKTFADAMDLESCDDEEDFDVAVIETAEAPLENVATGTETTYFDPDDATLPSFDSETGPRADRPSAKKYILVGFAAVFLVAVLAGVMLMRPSQNSEPVAQDTTPAAEQASPAPQGETTAALSVAEPGNKNVKGYYEITHPFDKSTMIHIPAGPFTMGSERYSSEKPVQKIFLDDYYIDKYLVTNAQFKAFVAAAPYATDAERAGGGHTLMARRWQKTRLATWQQPDGIVSQKGRDNYPVSQVSFNDARAYCRWSKKELPTEAQWEKAARGTDGGVYPWGSDMPDETLANFDNYHLGPTPVDAYADGQSPFGMFDAAGNLYQWMRDWYAEGGRDPENPVGAAKGTDKVVKGGAFSAEMGSLRAAHRDRYAPDYSAHIFGFRCAAPYPIDGLSNPSQ